MAGLVPAPFPHLVRRTLDRVPTPRTAHAPWMAGLLLSVLVSTSRAQTIEITPVAGCRIGGGNVNTNA